MSRHAPFLWLALVLAVCPWAAAQPSGESGATKRKPGPPLEVRTLGGTTLNVQGMRGKVVLVDFMTTTCPTCKLASAGLQKLYQELESKGFRTVAVALNADSTAALGGYKREFGLTFPLGIVPLLDAVKYLEHPFDKPLLVPTLVLLDRRGRICSVQVGWNREETLRSSILKLLVE